MSQNNQNTPGGLRLPPALNPETPALVQPFKDYVSKGYIRIKIEFDPMGTRISVVPLAPIRGDGENDLTVISIGEAKERIISAGLDTKKAKAKNGKKASGEVQPRPLKSLCKRDFEGNDKELLDRIRIVAKAIGNDVARSRILSARMNEEDYDTIEEWWVNARADLRTAVLVDAKHAKDIGHKLVKLEELDIDCPFRGPFSVEDRQEKQNQETPKGKGKAPATNGVTASNDRRSGGGSARGSPTGSKNGASTSKSV